MPTFEISIATTLVTLDAARHGEASFTIQNETGRPVRALARPTALPPTDATWLAIVGAGERDYEIGGLEQVTVSIDVPPEAAGGDYPFRLDVISVDRPDVDFALGATVTCQVPDTPPPPPPVERPGYLETLGGAAGGGLGAMLVGAAVGILAIVIFGKVGSVDDFWDAIGVLIGLFILSVLLAVGGLWAGAAGGAFLLLRAQRFRDPWRTALALGILFPFWGIAILLLLTGPANALDGAPPILGLVVVLVAIAAVIAVPALAGRAYARWRQEGHL